MEITFAEALLAVAFILISPLAVAIYLMVAIILSLIFAHNRASYYFDEWWRYAFWLIPAGLLWLFLAFVIWTTANDISSLFWAPENL